VHAAIVLAPAISGAAPGRARRPRSN